MRKMSNDVRQELRKYAVYQLIDYINEQTSGGYVSHEKLRILGEAVENICMAAFGDEHAQLIKKETPRILRATLETRQLGFGNKMLKFFDNKTRTQGNNIVSMILGDIIGKDTALAHSEKAGMIKASWAEKMKAEREKSVERLVE
jgi:hypothetical protein